MNWRKATHSHDQGACIEVASAPGLVLVRDTANRDGVTLTLTPAAWRQLTQATARQG
jgi:hypothetical protein